MQKWNLLKKTAPCILSLAVAATTFPTAVMASDLDAAVVSEAEAGDTEDFSTEETAEDTEAVAEEAIEDAADITEEAAEDAAVPEAAADEKLSRLWMRQQRKQTRSLQGKRISQKAMKWRKHFPILTS